jgi:hypothetical protein
MISIETRVNGNLVSHVYIGNTRIPCDGELKGCFVYNAEYHQIGKDGYIDRFNVVHNPEDGIEKLTEIVYKEISKRVKQKINKNK